VESCRCIGGVLTPDGEEPRPRCINKAGALALCSVFTSRGLRQASVLNAVVLLASK